MGLFSKGGGGQPAKTTQTTTSEPPAWVSPALNRWGSQVVDAAEEVPSTPFHQPAWSPGLKAAQQQAVRGSEQAQAQVMPHAMGAYRNIMSTTPFNPLTMGAIEAAQRANQRTFTQDTLPGLDVAGYRTGNLDSSRQGLAQGLAAQAYGQQQSDVAATIADSARQKQLEAQTKGLVAAPLLMQGATFGDQARLAGEQSANQLSEAQRRAAQLQAYSDRTRNIQQIVAGMNAIGAAASFGGSQTNAEQIARTAGSKPSTLQSVMQFLPYFFM